MIVHTKAVRATFSAGQSHYAVDLPAGLRCTTSVRTGTGEHIGYYLDEFPIKLFPARSMIRHDAEHYGLLLTDEQVDIISQ